MGEICVLKFLTICAVLGLTAALTIDNQLAIIKNDCYERLAIGQRLHPQDIYGMQNINTVPDCQQACTKEGDKCKSFSFGIGAEGNATCDLSMQTIRETIDLKPIGTVADTDYDLYIKKLGCKLVIEQTKPPQGPPLSSSSSAANAIEYSTVEYTNPSSSATSTYKPIYEISSTPLYHKKPTYGGEEIHQVQTLISIRPSVGLKPVIDENRPAHGSYDSRPPSNYGRYDFRPQLDFNTRPDHYDDSRPDFSFRPEYYSPDRLDYNPYSYARPPTYEIPLGYPPPRPIGYDTRPSPYNDRPYNSRPSISYEDSSSLDNHPFVNDRPLAYEGNQIYRLQRPIIDDNSRPQVRPNGGNDGYNSRPSVMEDNDSRVPVRPSIGDNGYQSRPIDDNNGYNSRPPVRPNGGDDGYNSRPPVMEDNDSRLPVRPLMEDNARPAIRPSIGDNGYHSRPIDDNNGYNSRPLVKPLVEDGDYNSRPPLRPIYENNGYNSRPLRPIDNGYNSRPPIRPLLEDDGYNSRPPVRPIVEYNRYKNGFIFDNPARPDPSSNSGYGPSYGSQYSNYQPSKLSEIISDYDRLPRPIKTKLLDDNLDDYNRPYGLPNSYTRYPSFNRPVYDGDLPPFRPSSLNHPYNENHSFRPAAQDYDPGPIRHSSGPDDSGYRGNSLESIRGPNGKGNGPGVNEALGKPVVSYNVGKNGEKIMGIIKEIDFDNSKLSEWILI